MEVLDANQCRANAPHLFPVSDALLYVSGLSVRFRLDSAREASVLRNVSFAIASGKIVGLLGESGCGKTTTALAMMQLLSAAAHVRGSIEFRGEGLLTLNESELRKIRGAEISIIYQDSNVLNPVMRVGDQVLEVLRAHKKLCSDQMREEVLALFTAVGFEDADRIYRAYPHQLSGGQRRRIAIAQALICKPQLVIADEPTAWLDADASFETLELIANLRDLYGTAFLLISHDPEALAAIADEVLVMYAGEIVESGPTHEVFAQPKHPYTEALLQCNVPIVAPADGRKHALPCIPGQAPDPSELMTGCSFAERCRDRMEVCNTRSPELLSISEARSVRCFKYGEGA